MRVYGKMAIFCFNKIRSKLDASFKEKILESWATPNWSKRSVGQEESRSQIPSPRSSIPDPEFQILNSNSQVPDPQFPIPDPEL